MKVEVCWRLLAVVGFTRVGDFPAAAVAETGFGVVTGGATSATGVAFDPDQVVVLVGFYWIGGCAVGHCEGLLGRARIWYDSTMYIF